MAAKKTKNSRVYLLWGQEELRKREALQQLIEELVPAEDRDLDVEYLDASNSGMSGDAILHAARDRAMFSERRVVIVLNAGRLRGPRHQRTQDTLAQGIATLPEFATLILMVYADDSDERRGRSPFGEKLMAAIKANGTVKQFSALKPEEMAELAVSEAALGGKKLAGPAAAQLANRVGADSQRLVHEVRKLISYVGDRTSISINDVTELVAPPPDDSIWHLLDAMMKGDRRQAINVLRDLRESGTVVQQILPMLAKTLRQVAQAKFLQERRVNAKDDPASVPPELLDALPEEARLFKGTQSEWQRNKLWGQARQISWAHLQQALDRLAVLDAGTKGWEYGIEDPDMALEVFLVSLCDTVQPEAGRPPYSGGGGYGGGTRGRR
ncbi:MAG: polymerase subunit delta [Armatimonadetes bacterium]|nr:polymerase subunit delta [Armatimonadota bacterium]